MVLDAFPKVNGAGGANAAVLNHSAMVGFASWSETPATTLGRFDVMLPCAVVTLPDADNDRVCPLWKVVISLMFHPPRIMRSHMGPVLKKGSAHRPVITR